MKRTAEIIVALDTPSRDRALELVRILRGQVSLFKIGLDLFTAAGPAVVKEVKGLGVEIFLDLKFHDIPHTVARAVCEAARLGAAMIDLHLSGGETMIRRAVDDLGAYCGLHGIRRPALLGVTVLTSLEAGDLSTMGIGRSPVEQVLLLAEIARKAGLDGVVAAGSELDALRRRFGEEWILVAPGIRPEGAAANDQARTLTPREAAEAGADYLVLGRPITGAEDPAAATRAIQQTLRMR